MGWLAGKQNQLTELDRRQDKEERKRAFGLAGLGAAAVGAAMVIAQKPELLKPLAAPAADFAGGTVDLAGDVAHNIGEFAQNLGGGGDNNAEAADMQSVAQAAAVPAVPPHSGDTGGNQEFTHLSQVTQTATAEGPADTLPETTQVASHAPSSGEDLTDRLSLQRDEHGNLRTKGLETWNEQPKEGELFQPGTGYNTMERLLREVGLTNEQIQELDKNGQLHDLVREMLHDSDVTYASEANDHPDKRPDNKLPPDFQFTISDDLLRQIHDLHPTEMQAAELLSPTYPKRTLIA
jgi:hypothetical protein